MKTIDTKGLLNGVTRVQGEEYCSTDLVIAFKRGKGYDLDSIVEIDTKDNYERMHEKYPWGEYIVLTGYIQEPLTGVFLEFAKAHGGDTYPGRTLVLYLS